MKVFAIIVTYNAQKWIDSCFGSLRRSSIPLHTIVVDNLSQDDTVSLLKRNYPEVELIENSQNSGFGQGNNIAIRRALDKGADYILLLNQDAWLFEDSVSKLIDASLSRPDAGIISPVHIDASLRKLDKYFSKYMLSAGVEVAPPCESLLSEYALQLPQLEIENPYTPQNQQSLFDVPFVNAAAWLLPRKTFMTVGGFDPIFFHYAEDVNYVLRAKYHNLKTIVVGGSFIVHDRAGTSRTNDRYSRWFKNYLLIRYSDINYGLLRISLITLPLQLKMIARLIADVIIGHNRESTNIRDGYRRLFTSWHKMKQSRRINRSVGQTWLDI